MRLFCRRLKIPRAAPPTGEPAGCPGKDVLFEPPVRRKDVPQLPVSFAPTFPRPIVRLNGVSQFPTNTLPNAPFRPSALLRVHQPSPVSPRKSALLVH